MSRSLGGRSLTTSPPITRSPSVMSSSPAIMRRAVDFPQPDGPTRIMNSPSRMSRFMSFTASKPSGYRFQTPSNLISAIGPLSSSSDASAASWMLPARQNAGRIREAQVEPVPRGLFSGFGRILRSLAQLRDGVADEPGDVHLGDADALADLGLREILGEAQAQDLALTLGEHAHEPLDGRRVLGHTEAGILDSHVGGHSVVVL